jgi:tRNA dimethylallyltransferase
MIYHLIDIREPDETMNLAEFQRLAREAWDDISKRGKLPILVGGTGLYIEAVITDLQLPEVKPDKKLRGKLEALSTEELAERFQELEPEAEMDLANRHRLIRSIEKLAGGAELKGFEQAKIIDGVIVVAPERDPEELRQIITARVDTMVTAGLPEEVQWAYERYAPELPSMSCIAFPIFKRYLDGEISIDEAKTRFATGDAQYAKRQRTWWRRRPEVNWLESYEEARELVREHLKA